MDQKLQTLCPIPLQISWHESRSYLSFLKKNGTLFLRLHRLFLEAPSPVLEAVIRMVLRKNDLEARAIVRKMAHLYFSQKRLPPKKLTAQGTTYDLQMIYEKLKERHFSPDYSSAIGWSKASRQGRFRFITFGSYDQHRDQIRINPLLDSTDVPLYFLEFIVYHEMLHAVCRPKMDPSGRCSVHTAEFRAKERQFPQYKEAKEWEKSSLKIFKKRRQLQNSTTLKNR